MYTLLVTGDVPGAATYFNPLLQQTIIPCTSGTRPAPSHEGMHVYETDTDRLMKYNGSFWEAVAGSRQSHTPTLTASTTNPTLGTGNKAVGFYSFLPGSSIFFSFFIRFGSSGANAGSGQYLVSLPVAAANSHTGDQPAMGSGMVRDDSGSTVTPCVTYIPGSNLSVVSLHASGQTTPVGSTNPWTWANNDYLAGSITYPA